MGCVLIKRLEIHLIIFFFFNHILFLHNTQNKMINLGLKKFHLIYFIALIGHKKGNMISVIGDVLDLTSLQNMASVGANQNRKRNKSGPSSK